MNLADILKNSNYKLSQFTKVEIEQLAQTIILKDTKSGEVPYTICWVRQKAIKLTPGVFSDESKISLTPSHLSVCVSYNLR